MRPSYIISIVLLVLIGVISVDMHAYNNSEFSIDHHIKDIYS